ETRVRGKERAGPAALAVPRGFRPSRRGHLPPVRLLRGEKRRGGRGRSNQSLRVRERGTEAGARGGFRRRVRPSPHPCPRRSGEVPHPRQSPGRRPQERGPRRPPSAGTIRGRRRVWQPQRETFPVQGGRVPATEGRI
ncbi:MAG: hypothetical protein AVDCRST_MAG55-1793, partial [uncultured Rubrobacteraceae bacterium]